MTEEQRNAELLEFIEGDFEKLNLSDERKLLDIVPSRARDEDVRNKHWESIAVRAMILQVRVAMQMNQKLEMILIELQNARRG